MHLWITSLRRQTFERYLNAAQLPLCDLGTAIRQPYRRKQRLFQLREINCGNCAPVYCSDNVCTLPWFLHKHPVYMVWNNFDGCAHVSEAVTPLVVGIISGRR